MEHENSVIGEDNDDPLTTDQIKLKAQEIAKRYEKYQGRYHTSSSRCNTPLPLVSADSIDSIHSNSVTAETSEKIVLFRQCLENDRKLVENSKVDEKKLNNNEYAHNETDIELQNEKEKLNTKYYEDIISAQLHEKNVNLLKSQVVELKKELNDCHKIIKEKDILLQSKIDKLESLNQALVQKNNLHLETVESLKKRNIEVVNNERLRSAKKINHLIEETAELKNNLEYVQQLCEELKINNTKIDEENNELRKKERSQKSDFEKLVLNFETEKKALQNNYNETLKKTINDVEKKLLNLQEENESLKKHIVLSESKPVNTQEIDNLLDRLTIKEAENDQLNLKNETLSKQLEEKAIEVQETENRWIQLKDAYLKDKDRASFLEKVIEELKISNDELNMSNVELIEKVEKSSANLTMLRAENNAHENRIADLMAVIENMREQFEKAMKETTIECENDKKQLIKLHETDVISFSSCNKKLEKTSLELNEMTNKLNIVMKENDLYKNKNLELNNRLNENNAQILELNNFISDLQKQTSHTINELNAQKRENTVLFEQLKGTGSELEENKILSERFQKQKQLLKVKVKALKESENNCCLLKQQVSSLSNEVQTLHKKSNDLVQNNKQINIVLQYCTMELQECYELLNKFITKSSLDYQNIFTLRCLFISLASLFSFDEFNIELFDIDLLKTVDSICNTVTDDNELQICVKKIILSSIYILEHTINLNYTNRRSRAQLIAKSEVEKLVSEAEEKVKLSTETEYKNINSQLLGLIESLQNENRTLKLKNSDLVNKEVITDLNACTMKSLLAFEKNLDVNNIIDENNTLKQFLKNIRGILGLVEMPEKEGSHLQYFLSEYESLIKNLKNEHIMFKNKNLKYLEQPIEQQIPKSVNLNVQNSFSQPIENVEENGTDDIMKYVEEKEKSNSTTDSVAVSGDPKVMLSRYRNLKLKFKEVRAKSNDLEKRIDILTKDLECANSKYKQLENQHAYASEAHEVEMAHCQTEIENLMSEKLEANRQLIALKEKHEILQNDYDQLKSNFNDQISNDTETDSHNDEQNKMFKRKLDDVQNLIDSTYSKVLCELPPIDTSPDWVMVQSEKLEKIANAKCIPLNISCDNDLIISSTLGESEFIRLETCVQVIHELVTSILNDRCVVNVSPPNLLVDLMSNLKTCTETFLEFMSIKNNSPDKCSVKLSYDKENSDVNSHLSNKSTSDEIPIIKSPILIEDTGKASLSEYEENQQFLQSLAERDRLIEFLTEKISKLDNLNRKVDEIKLVRDKLDKALTAIHERDIRCDELTLELTRLLEERDMLQLKLSNAIRQIQFLSENKHQSDTTDLLKEKYDLKTIDDKLEELHSLEYRKDADLYTDREQRHMSQMQLHQSHQDDSSTLKAKSNNITEEAKTSQSSWFKDILW